MHTFNLQTYIDFKASPTGATKQTALTSRNLQLEKAVKTLRYNTTKWRNQCAAEYLKELARIYLVHGIETALNPDYSDIAIAGKLRMAGFSCYKIYQTILRESPIIASLPSIRHQTTYLENGIKPHLVNPQMRKMMRNFNDWRREQAQKISDPVIRDTYLGEMRLYQLGLATEMPTTVNSRNESTISLING
ncbi:hypothetical protein HW132_07035 [Brasilonema sp. CT11]|nr:hypothetical protein [Brasilonema sp. CT11]